MPGGDGTGPHCEGRMTGRALGRCAGYPDGGYARAPGRGGLLPDGGYARAPGRGGLLPDGGYARAPGRGGGRRGFRNRFYATGLPYWRRYEGPDGYIGGTDGQDTEDLKVRVRAVSDVVEGLARRVEELVRSRKDSE